ncbi:hypothetical protein GO491_03985 [Flavobacteriaceae bacterium Ap0902]|nr:hypothetical protein [Flavobacteriaceae bacterium Ap0902]
MQWFKSFLISILIGVYFFNITPMHFLLHNSSLDNTHQHQTLQDCNYIKLVTNGQDSFLNSDSYTLTEQIENIAISSIIISKDKNITTRVLRPYFSLRAPPIA